MTRRMISFLQPASIISANLLIRDPEDRYVSPDNEAAVREKMLDKTLADSYPASDPPSTLPNPSVDSLSLSEGDFPPTERAALEEFAKIHELPERWLHLRHEVDGLVRRPGYWYQPEMQNAARILATEASDIFHSRLKDGQKRKGTCGERNRMIA